MKNSVTLKSLDAIERALCDVQASDGANLEFSKSAFNARQGALHDAARLQVFVTWARRYPDEPLKLHGSNSVASVVESLCDYAPGIAALRLSHSLKVGGAEVSRHESLRPAAKKMHDEHALALTSIIKGRSIDLTCVSGSKVQYLDPLFYSASPKSVRPKEDMEDLFRTLVRYLGRGDSPDLSEQLIYSMGIFANELFSNTQQHATRDHTGTPYLSHLEGLIFSWKQLHESGDAEDYQSAEELREFWRAAFAHSKRVGVRGSPFFQISFFDTGPGLAPRFAGKPLAYMSRTDERDALVSCFASGATTKDRPGSGIGLPFVLRQLAEVGGLIRIRSGRHCLFLAPTPGDAWTPRFHDWWPQRELAEATGAVVSLIIPLRQMR